MTQIRDDCFAFDGGPLPVADALVLIAERVSPIEGIDEVPLAIADGRVLAVDVHAVRPLPPFVNSAVDGWGVRHADLAPNGDTRLPVGGRVAAGGAWVRQPVAGHATRLFTGAPVPQGIDTIFMQEDVTVDDHHAVLPQGLTRGANLRNIGEDIEKDARALAAGTRLRPQDVALAAALGCTGLKVRRRPRVALFSTGDELREPGEALTQGAIFDSNRILLASLLRRLGADVSDLGIVRDRTRSLEAALRAAARDHDLIVTSGGVSVGEEDHVRTALAAAGTLVFWRLAIKPGRPVALGVLAGTPFVGLPGNPVAAFITFIHVVRPLLDALSGASPSRSMALPVPLAFDYRKKAGRREYVRARLRRAPDGTVVADKFPRAGVALLSSLTETDGLVELLEPCVGVAKGDVAGFWPYSLLW